ncbi:MAG: transglycosylase SLT domain-containing protein [Deltaproteobacteria bacterium]|nr:transglycosylase SLT domain-containing protein [Deltaproteobacteria bacterium]
MATYKAILRFLQIRCLLAVLINVGLSSCLASNPNILISSTSAAAAPNANFNQETNAANAIGASKTTSADTNMDVDLQVNDATAANENNDDFDYDEAEIDENDSDSDAQYDAETAISKILEQCEAAAKLLADGDQEGAIKLIDEAYSSLLHLPATDETNAQSKQDIRLLIADLINKTYRNRTFKVDPTSYAKALASFDLGMPIFDNQYVQREIKSFLTQERDHFFLGYQRSGRYRQMIVEKLKKAGLPTQLSWLPLVESSFKVKALSRAGAFGLWQFISSTGLRYHLKRNNWVDERLDPEKATDAAITYLTDLHLYFGDWLKALAAYNCGEGAIMRVQRRSPQQYVDFWDMYPSLPAETRRYVPRLLAVLHIINDPEKFGVTLPSLDSTLGEIREVTINRSVRLDALEAAINVPKNTLLELNPQLRSNATPKEDFILKIPNSNTAEQITAAIAQLPEYIPPKPKYTIHRVRSGETLSRIAVRYRVRVSSIVRENNLRSTRLIWPGQRLRIPLRR